MAGLPRLLRRLCRVSLLVFQGENARLGRELRAALSDGLDAETLREAILQTYLFAGYPRAINALAELAAIVPCAPRAPVRRALGPWRRRGVRLCRRVYGRTYEAMLAQMRRLHPDLADWILWEGYGKVLSRPALDARTRELCVIPVLAAGGMVPQLRSHLAGARNCGATAEEARGALEIGLAALPRRDAARVRRGVER